MILSSPFMHLYVLLALEKHDKFQDIIRIIKIKWGYWAKKNILQRGKIGMLIFLMEVSVTLFQHILFIL